MSVDRPLPPALVQRINAGLERYTGAAACPWTSAMECAMAAERGAAGTSAEPTTCPTHPLVTACGHGCGLPIILNTDTGEWGHHWTPAVLNARGNTFPIETAIAADADHVATPDDQAEADVVDLDDCGCPIEYLQDEGDHQSGCRLARD